MGKKSDLTSKVAEFLQQCGWNQKHKSAILILIRRIADMEKQRRPYTCLENIAIDEIGDELLGSLECLLKDKQKED